MDNFRQGIKKDATASNCRLGGRKVSKIKSLRRQVGKNIYEVKDGIVYRNGDKLLELDPSIVDIISFKDDIRLNIVSVTYCLKGGSEDTIMVTL